MAKNLARRVNQQAVVSAVHAEGVNRRPTAGRVVGYAATAAAARVPKAVALGVGGRNPPMRKVDRPVRARDASSAAQCEVGRGAVGRVVVLRAGGQNAVPAGGVAGRQVCRSLPWLACPRNQPCRACAGGGEGVLMAYRPRDGRGHRPRAVTA